MVGLPYPCTERIKTVQVSLHIEGFPYFYLHIAYIECYAVANIPAEGHLIPS